MCRKLFLLAITVLYASVLFAQKDAKAKEILDQSSEKFNKSGGISASFTLNVKHVKEKVTESFDGNIQMKGNKFYLSTPETDSWFDGKTQWVYLKGNREVNVTEPSQEELQMLNPSFLFNVYKKGFNYKYVGEKTDIKGKLVHEIKLTPQKKTEMKEMIVQVSKGNLLPTIISIINKNEINNIIYINKYETGKNYPDNIFSFDKKKFPDVEIIDLR